MTTAIDFGVAFFNGLAMAIVIVSIQEINHFIHLMVDGVVWFQLDFIYCPNLTLSFLYIYKRVVWRFSVGRSLIFSVIIVGRWLFNWDLVVF